MDFLKWYKYKVESGDQEPPESIWENIQDELDIEQSWQVIDHYLTQKSAQRRNTILAIAAGFLILISIGTFWYTTRDNSPDEFQSLAINRIQAEDETSGTEASSSEQAVNADEIQEQIPAKDTEINPAQILVEKTYNKQAVPGEIDERDGYRQVPARPTYTTLERRAIAMNVDMDSDGLLENTHNLYIEEDTKQRTSFRKLYIGSTGQLANTWLLNEKTMTGLERSSLTSSDVSIGSNFGLFLGTNLFSRIDLQMDLNILAQNNQTYHEYLSGHYVENRMKFNYSQLGVSLRYNFISNGRLRGEHGINVGGYAGYMHNAYQTIGNDNIDLTSNYTKLDYGVFMGYEYVFPIYRKLGIGTGFRVYYGLRNIYSGNGSIPAYMNETNNASANLTLSLKYLVR